jgi:hypothetical protein
MEKLAELGVDGVGDTVFLSVGEGPKRAIGMQDEKTRAGRGEGDTLLQLGQTSCDGVS